MPDDRSGNRNNGGGRNVRKESIEMVELRGDVPRYMIDMIDAVAKAKKTNRMAIVRGVLNHWIKEKLDEATIVKRVMRGYGNDSETFPEASATIPGFSGFGDSEND